MVKVDVSGDPGILDTLLQVADRFAVVAKLELDAVDEFRVLTNESLSYAPERERVFEIIKSAGILREGFANVVKALTKCYTGEDSIEVEGNETDGSE